MLKQKLLKLFLNTFPTLSLLILAKPVSAWDPVGDAVDDATESIMESLGGALTSAIASLFAWLANIISTLLFDKLLSPILNIVKEDSNILLNHEIAQNVWTGSLAVANGLFLLALVLASVAIILRLNTGMYNLKKVLGGFIAAVILSNLSLLIVRVLVELGDNLTIAAYGLFTSIDSRLTYDIINGPDGFITALTKIKASVGAEGVGGDEHMGAVLLAIIIMVLIFWILLKLTLILIERMFWIFLMAISAPIIFALSLLPTTQKLAADWWNKLIKWILVLPLVAAILSISVYFLILTVEGPDGGAINPAEFVAQLTEPRFFAELISGGKGIFLIVGLIILYQAGRANNLLGISGGGLSGAVDTPKAMGKTAKGAVKGTVGAVTKPIADTFTGKNKLGKFGKATKEGTARLAGSGKLGKWVQDRAVQGAAWKKRQTGLIGMAVNPKGRAEKLDADIKLNEEKELNNQNGRALDHNNKKLNARTKKRFGKRWDDMRPDEQETAKKTDKATRGFASTSEGLKSELMWRSRNLAHDVKREDLKPPSAYEKIIKDPKSTTGEIAVAGVQLRRISSNKNNVGATEAREILDDPENIATIQSRDLDIINFSMGRRKELTAPSMVESIKATQNTPRYSDATATRLDELNEPEFKLMEQIATGNPEDEIEARKKLDELGIKSINEQNKIISAGRTEKAKEAIAESKDRTTRPDGKTSRSKRKKSHTESKKAINATIQILTEAQEARKVINQVNVSHESTVENATVAIENQIDDTSISMTPLNAETMSAEAQRILGEVAEKIKQNPDISGSGAIRELELGEDGLEAIQKVLSDSGLFVGKRIDTTAKIKNANTDTILGHISTVQKAAGAAAKNRGSEDASRMAT